MAKDKADIPSFRNFLTFRLHMVARISEGISEDYYKRHLGLSLPECRVMGITASYGSVSFKQVAAEANLEKSYASRVVSSLVERGLVEKHANPSDSRSVLLQLTESGSAVHKQTHELAVRLNDALQMPFSRSQVSEFMTFLLRLEHQLKRLSDVAEDDSALELAPRLRKGIPAPQLPDSADEALLDRAFARELHEMLGRYLNSEE